MKKTLITILIIIILAGAGYFAYSKGLIKLDFLNKTKLTQNQIEEVKTTQEEPSKKDESISQHQGAYHFGMSEGESTLLLMYKDGKYYAQIHSGLFNDDATDFIWHYENLTNVRVEGNKFYSDKTDGEFGTFEQDENADFGIPEGKVEGLKVYKSWSNMANLKPEIGSKISSNVEDFKQSEFKLSNGTWSVKSFLFSCTKVCAMSDEDASQWLGKNLFINDNKMSFEFSKIPLYKNEKSNCTILNLDNPNIQTSNTNTETIYTTDCTSPAFSSFTLNKNNEIKTGVDGVEFILTKK